MIEIARNDIKWFGIRTWDPIWSNPQSCSTTVHHSFSPREKLFILTFHCSHWRENALINNLGCDMEVLGLQIEIIGNQITPSWKPKWFIMHFLAMSCNERLEWKKFLLMFEIYSNVKITLKDNLRATYHFKAILLDAWEACLCAIIPLCPSDY